MKKNSQTVKYLLRGTVIAGIILLCAWLFFLGLGNLSRGQREEGRLQLEESIRRATVACYAAEGVYPPDIAYLQEHYGLQIDESRYTVFYDIFGSNLMPDITVVEK